MPIDKKTRELYDTLKGGGADVGTPEEFYDYCFPKGQPTTGYNRRREIWRTLKEGGADTGSYEEFAGWWGYGATKPKPAVPSPQGGRGFLSRMVEAGREKVSQAAKAAKTMTQPVASGVKPTAAKAAAQGSAARIPAGQAAVPDYGKVFGSSLSQPSPVTDLLKFGGKTPEEQAEIRQKDAEQKEKAQKEAERQRREIERKQNQDKAREGLHFEDGVLVTPEMERAAIRYDITTGSYERKQRAEKSINEYVGELDEALSDYEKAHTKDLYGSRLSRLTGEAALSFEGPTIGAKGRMDYILRDRSNENSINDEADRLRQSRRLLSGALDVIKASKEDSGFVRGLYDTAKQGSTWDFGFTDMIDAVQVLSAVEKYESGSELTKGEEALLKSTAIAAYVGGAYDLSRAYNIGAGTAASVPFIIETILSSGMSGAVSAAAKAAVKGAVKGAVKKVTKKVVKNKADDVIADAAKKTLSKAVLDKMGKVAKGTASAALQGAVQTGTVGLGHVASGTAERMTGDIKPDINENGEVIYGGRENAKSPLQAFRESFTSDWIERTSELLGDKVLEPGLSLLKRAATSGKGSVASWISANLPNLTKSGKYTLDKVKNMLNTIAPEKLRRAWNYTSELRRRAHIQGIVPEYFEELTGSIADATLVGDQKWVGEDGKIFGSSDPSAIFNYETQLDTALGLLPMQIFFGATNMISFARMRHKAPTLLADANHKAHGVFGESWNLWKDVVDNSSDKDLARQITTAIKIGSMTQEQASALQGYAAAKVAFDSVQLASEKEDRETGDSSNISKAFNIGYQLTDEQNRNSIEQDYAASQEEGYEGDALLAQARYMGMKQREADDRRGIMLSRVGKDGKLHPAKVARFDSGTKAHAQDDVYIIDGNVVLNDDGTVDQEGTDDMLIVVDDSGNRHTIFKGDIDSVGEVEEIPSEEELNAPTQALEEVLQEKGDSEFADTENVVEGSSLGGEDRTDEADDVDVNSPLAFAEGDVYEFDSGDGRTIRAEVIGIDDEDMVVLRDLETGEEAAFYKDVLQSIVDDYRLEQARQRLAGQAAQEGEANQQEAVEGSPESETVNVEGNTQPGQQPVPEEQPQTAQPAEAPVQATEQPTAEPYIGAAEIDDVFYGPSRKQQKGTLRANIEGDVIKFEINGRKSQVVIQGTDWVTSEETTNQYGQVSTIGITSDDLDDFGISKDSPFTVTRIFKSQRDGKWYAEGFFEVETGKSISDRKDKNLPAMVELSQDFNINRVLEREKATRDELYKNKFTKRSVPQSKEESVGVIQSIVNQSKSIKDRVVRYVIGALSARQKSDIASQGLELDDDYVHSVENSAIQHNQKEHGNPQVEEKRGQIAITERDYELIPDILDGYDEVKKSDRKDSQGRDVLVYTKAYPDGAVYYLEEVREGRKSLAFKTMYKKKNGTGGSDGLMPGASPSTPLAPSDISNSVGKGSSSSADGKVNVGENVGTGSSEDVTPMPMREDGSPDFAAAGAARTHRFLSEESGMSGTMARNFAKANAEKARKDIDDADKKLRKLEENPGTDFSGLRKKIADLQARKEEAEQSLSFWNEVKGEQDKAEVARREEQRKRDAEHQAAVDADEQAYLEEEAAKAAERRKAESVQQDGTAGAGGEGGEATAEPRGKVAAGTDAQGNDVDAQGNLVTERVSSAAELTDEDFTQPKRSVELEGVPANVRGAIGAEDKPIVIKKNIFEKNKKDHADLTPEQSREIITSALYDGDLYGQNKPVSRPYNWVVISTKDAEGKNRLVLLEVNNGKDNVEIVHWHYIRDNALETIKRQAAREGGQILILPSEEEAGGLSSRTRGSSSEGKGSEKSATEQGKGEKSGENQISTTEWNGHKVGDRYLAPNDSGETAEIIGFDYTHAGENGMPEVLLRGYDKDGNLLGTEAVPPLVFEENVRDLQKLEAEPQPVGKGVFGNIYDQFKGKAKEAFEFLLKNKGGDAVAVWSRQDVGDIDLVYGDREKSTGLDHIIHEHVGEGLDFADEQEMMVAIDDVVRNGSINEKKSKWDKVVLEKDGRIVVVRKNVRDGEGNITDNKNWVVTSFDINIPKSKKSAPAATRATLDSNEGGRAVAPGASSEGKGTEKSATVQGKGREIAAEALYEELGIADEVKAAGEVREQKVGGRSFAATENEGVFVEAMAEHLNGMGVETFADAETGQRMLDADRERRAKLMGSRVEKRKARIAAELQGRELTEEQQAVVDVFTGANDNRPLVVTDKDGKERRVVMRQGNEQGAGTKHSIFGHYGTNTNGYTAEDILLIPDIVKNGERSQRGGKVAYEIVRDGITYTVTTEQSKSGLERFTNFYTNRKPTAVVNGTSNTDEQHVSQQPVSGAKLQKVPEKDAAETEKIFDAAKKRFGVTTDIREAGYILPDGTMLDFSGRHQMDEGMDTSSLRGQRSVDHRDVKQLNYEADGNTPSGIDTSMPDFIERGAIRIDASAGTVNLSRKPTQAQREVLRRLVARNDGAVSVDFGNGWDSDHYAEYDEAKPLRVLSDIDRYFDEGIKPTGDFGEEPMFFRTADGEAYGFTLDGRIYIDPRIATRETPLHEYDHLWSEALERANPEAWEHLKGRLREDGDLLAYVRGLYPEAEDENALMHEVFSHFAGRRGAERLKEMEQEEVAKTRGVLNKARIVDMFRRLGDFLRGYWTMARDLFAGKNERLKDMSAEDFADMAMSDFVRGFNPRGDAGVAERDAAKAEREGVGSDDRLRTSDELTGEYGDRWLEEQTNDDGRHTTQVRNTIRSYEKFGEFVKRDSGGRDVSVLDASSGLGHGTQWMRENGMSVDDVEPYPSADREKPTFGSYDEIDKKYDYIISNAVLNVIPDDWRAGLLHNMAGKLKPGGKLVINVRGAESIRKQGKEGVTRITLDDPSEILVLRPDGSIKAYQKGFTKAELKEWCEKELGEGYSVELATKENAGGTYDTAVVVTKNNESTTREDNASELGQPTRKGAPVAKVGAKVGEKSERSKRLAELFSEISKKGALGGHQILHKLNVALNLDITPKEGERTSTDHSMYYDLGNGVSLRVADHYGNADTFDKHGHPTDNYGIVVKLSPSRFKEKEGIDYLEYVYFPDKMTDAERQKEVVAGLKGFVETGDFNMLPKPDKVNTSGVFKEASEKSRREAEGVPERMAGESLLDYAGRVDAAARKRAAHEHIDSMASRYGTKGHCISQAVHDEADLAELKKVVDAETYEKVERYFHDAETGGVYMPGRELAVIFTGKFESAEAAELSWWHEQTHHAYKYMSPEMQERYGRAAMEYLEKEYPEVAEHIKDKYEEKYWQEEAVAYFAEKTIGRHGAEKFLSSHFDGNADIANLAAEIQKSLKYGRERETGDKLRRDAEAGKEWQLAGDADRLQLHESGGRGEGAQGGERERSEGGGDTGRLSASDDAAELAAYDAGRMTAAEAAAQHVAAMSAKNRSDVELRRQAVQALGGNLQKLRQAMARQREYDRGTVDGIVRQARMMLEGGMLDGMTRGEVKKLLSLVNKAAGREDITRQAEGVVELMARHLVRQGKATMASLLRTRDKKVNAKGVEAQGRLDVAGQRMIDAFRDALPLDEAALADRIADCEDRMDSENEVTVRNAEAEYEGLMLARQHLEEIKESEAEEAELRRELKEAGDEVRGGDYGRFGSREAYREYVRETESAIRDNLLDRVEAYGRLNRQFGGSLVGSAARARAFRERERERIREIHHNANSDLEGRPANEHGRIRKTFRDWGAVRFFMKPLATFDTMLRYFGGKSVDGRGYLFNRFMPQWQKAFDGEFKSLRDAHKELDAKVSELMGMEMRWSDLFTLERLIDAEKGGGTEVEFTDDGKKVRMKLTQGNLLYIYMVNKMADGRMKLRGMGITEEDVEAMKSQINPVFIKLADWIQDEFLVKKREEYNAVHERMFGASMAAIDDYFPLKINDRSRGKSEDVGSEDNDSVMPGTVTGSVKKRTRNGLALDITGADAFDVVLEHLQEMEHWAHFAELNRDLNTLLSYKRFKNRVLGMKSLRYGGGEQIWKSFRDTCRIVAGTYRPKVNDGDIDKIITNVAKGVTTSKISFRHFTGLKQLLSYPAYLSNASITELAKSSNPAGMVQSWNWAIENLPGFAQRWQSRQAGDTRLMDTDSDWKIWHSETVKEVTRLGLTPNAFVDGMTVAMGAKAVYETKLKGYRKAGYGEKQAREKALMDASIAYNETQQSSASAYVSAMQLDRTVASSMLTVFRNASMGYGRKYFGALANMKRKMRKGYKAESIAFMAKQVQREWNAAANEEFNEELQQQIDGTLPEGHIYHLGLPSKVLLSTGFPNVPIEMSASHLAEKAAQRGHEFSVGEMKDLVKALQDPVAVFSYGDAGKAQNVIVDIEHEGKHFLVGIHLSQERRGAVVNDIRGLFPKDNAEWLNWISQNKHLYLDKEKIQAILSQQRTNPAEVAYLDLDDVANIVRDFRNPNADVEFVSQEAKDYAERLYAESHYRDLADTGIFGFVLEFAWNLGPYLPYLLLGDDDDEKDEMLVDAAMHALAGGVEGLTGGNVMSDLYNLKRTGGNFRDYNFSLLPLLSDLQTMWNHFDNDAVSGITDLINIAVQSGFGFNPQTATDGIVALLDACEGDMGFMKEAGLFAMRALQFPQSGLDGLLIDELGIDKDDAAHADFMDIATRYARYKRRRQTPLLGWLYSDEEKAAKEEKKISGTHGFSEKVKERLSKKSEERIIGLMNSDDKKISELAGKEYGKRASEFSEERIIGLMNSDDKKISELAGKEYGKRASEFSEERIIGLMNSGDKRFVTIGEKEYGKRLNDADSDVLQKKFESGGKPERKLISSKYAKDLGKELGVNDVDSWAGNPDAGWKEPNKKARERYLELRNYFDMAEDALIGAARKKFKEEGNEEDAKALSEAMNELRAIERGDKTHYGLGELNANEDRFIMDAIREKRSEIIREFRIR